MELEGNEYLEFEGDKIGFLFYVKVPDDADIERDSGYHGISCIYNLDIYSRDGFGFYSNLEASTGQDKAGGYSVESIED